MRMKKRESLLQRRQRPLLTQCLWLAAFLLVLFAIFPPAASTQSSADQASLDGAIEQARQRTAADPSSAKAQVTLGDLLLTRGSLDEAQKAFEAALSLNARDHDALTGKGMVLARKGKDQEAEAVLRKALMMNPNPVRTFYELGMLFEKKGDYAKAIAEYKNGIEKYKQGRR